MELKNSETLKNITRAFGSECMDGAKYQYMADEATQQKLSYVSTILKQLATNEMAHAKVLYDYVAQNVNEKGLNVELKASYPMSHAPLLEMLKIKGENEKKQATTVYPAFASTAQKEGFIEVAEIFTEIAKIEARHAEVLDELYNKMADNTLYNYACPTLIKCNNCGHEAVTKKAWKKCPLCNMAQGYVKINLSGSNQDCNCVSKPAKPKPKQKKQNAK